MSDSTATARKRVVWTERRGNRRHRYDESSGSDSCSLRTLERARTDRVREGKRSRYAMYDADDPGTIINEFLITLFVPGITIFASLWAVFRLFLNEFLSSIGLGPLVPAYGVGAIESGYGRMLLLILLTTGILLPYGALSHRVRREPLRERGIVVATKAKT